MAVLLRVLVGLVGVLLAYLGVRWMFAPTGAAQEFDIVLASVEALNQARGDLGGLFLGGAALCALGLRSGDGRWLQAVALVIGCVALGRVVGIVLDGFTGVAAVSITFEVAMVAILLAAARTPAR